MLSMKPSLAMRLIETFCEPKIMAFGAVATGSSGTFECTFGTETSSNATNNIVMVRFKMTAGQQITALSFTSS